MLACLLKQTTSSLASSNIELVSSSSLDRTGSIPAHQSGDLIIAVASNFDSGDVPAIPSGWTSVIGGGDSNPGAGWYLLFRLVSKIASSNSETISWDSSVDIVTYVVLRNASAVTFKGISNQSTLFESVTAPAISFSETNGSSAALILSTLRLKNGVTVSKPNISFIQTHSTNVGSHQGTAFLKSGINYFPETVLEADQLIQYAVTISLEVSD